MLRCRRDKRNSRNKDAKLSHSILDYALAMSSSRRCHEKKHRFSKKLETESRDVMDTSIGSDGQRSDNDDETEELTPSTTPVSKRSTNEFVLKLKFSIENILKPEFGRRGANSDTSGSPPTFATTPSPLSSPRCAIAGQFGEAGGRTSTSAKVSSQSTNAPVTATTTNANASLWPAWVYCTRYSDRPSSGPRCRRAKRSKANKQEDKRPRTAFTGEQLSRLKAEFQENRYLTEKRRQDLARELGLNESQIKIWFQNKRAKIKKQTGGRNILALHLMAQGLYNHATIPVVGNGVSPDQDDDDIDVDDDDDDDDDMIAEN